MDLDDFRNSKYLTQRDIENLSAKERLVTVDHVEVERVGEENVLKPVAYFVTLVKGLVTNITNGEVLSDIVGSIKLVDWHGADVEIYVDPSVGYGGKRTGGIRLRPIPTHKSQTVEEEYDEVMTFGDKEVA